MLSIKVKSYTGKMNFMLDEYKKAKLELKNTKKIVKESQERYKMLLIENAKLNKGENKDYYKTVIETGLNTLRDNFFNEIGKINSIISGNTKKMELLQDQTKLLSKHLLHNNKTAINPSKESKESPSSPVKKKIGNLPKGINMSPEVKSAISEFNQKALILFSVSSIKLTNMITRNGNILNQLRASLRSLENKVRVLNKDAKDRIGPNEHVNKSKRIGTKGQKLMLSYIQNYALRNVDKFTKIFNKLVAMQDSKFNSLANSILKLSPKKREQIFDMKLSSLEWKCNPLFKLKQQYDNWFKIIQSLIFKKLEEKFAPVNYVCGQLIMLCSIRKSDSRKIAELIEDIRKRNKLIKLMKKKLDSKTSSLKSFKGEFNQYMGKIEEGKSDLDSYKHKMKTTIKRMDRNFKTLSNDLNKTKDEIKERIKSILEEYIKKFNDKNTTLKQTLSPKIETKSKNSEAVDNLLQYNVDKKCAGTKSTEDFQRIEELKAAQHYIENLLKTNEELQKTNQYLEKKRKDDARILLERLKEIRNKDEEITKLKESVENLQKELDIASEILQSTVEKEEKEKQELQAAKAKIAEYEENNMIKSEKLNTTIKINEEPGKVGAVKIKQPNNNQKEDDGLEIQEDDEQCIEEPMRPIVLNESIEEFKSTIEKLQGKIKDLEVDNIKLKKKNEDLDSAMQNFSMKSLKLQQENQELKSQLDLKIKNKGITVIPGKAKNDKVTELEKKLSDAESKLKRLNTDRSPEVNTMSLIRKEINARNKSDRRNVKESLRKCIIEILKSTKSYLAHFDILQKKMEKTTNKLCTGLMKIQRNTCNKVYKRIDEALREKLSKLNTRMDCFKNINQIAMKFIQLKAIWKLGHSLSTKEIEISQIKMLVISCVKTIPLK